MRYILDDYNYVGEVTFGGYIQCNNNSCTEYTGVIPSGYGSLEEWHENANIRAYKIVDGNLVYDATRDNELQALYELEAEQNRNVTYKELKTTLSSLNIEASNQEELGGILPIRSESGKVITLFDSSSYPLERMEIECNEEIVGNLKLYISTSNMLPNEAVSSSMGGITCVVNDDKSISLRGNATDFALNISGSETNKKPLFIFKAGETYYINEVAENVNLNLYTHDGTDRILFYTGVGGNSITLDVDVAITQAEITCVGEVNQTIKLMITTGTARKYEPCINNVVTIDLNKNTADKGSTIEIEDWVIMLDGDAVNVMELPCTYFEKTIIYTDKNTTLDIDYKKSSFDYTTKSGRGTLKLRNTADGYGSIRLFTIDGLEAGSIYTLETTDNDEQVERYQIDLTDYLGTVDIAIEEGKVWVLEDGLEVGVLDSIFIRTYSPTTYISVLEGSYRMMAEYMIASDFSIYCTKVEKDASIKMLDDKISMEVSRASKVEGELRGAINIEADRVEQIVESVGTDGEVTAASIVTAINEGESSIKLKANKIDLEGTTFPTIQNEVGDCSVTTLFNSPLGDGIEYNSPTMHVFNGSLVINSSLPLYGLQVKDTLGTELLRVRNGMVVVGNTGVEVNLFGTVKINGEDISATMLNIETILNTLNSGGGV